MAERYRAALEDFYAGEWTRLAPLACASAEWLARSAGITTPARLASDLAVTTTDPTGRLVALCRVVGADTYLAGREEIGRASCRERVCQYV